MADRELHVTVLNSRGQYSVWPSRRDTPPGWEKVGRPAALADCTAAIDALWTDVGPHSTDSPVPTVPELVRARARLIPGHPAVISEHGSLDYAELDRRSDLLARRLRERGVGVRSTVTVCHDRSPAMVVALLAVLKSGAAFLPLDPGLPRRRLDRLVADSDSALVLTDRDHTWLADRSMVADTDGPDPGGPLPVPGPEDPAYLIYTSGSTGEPKGVMVGHRSFATVLGGLVEAYGLRPEDRVFQLAALGFDTSLEQIFAPLIGGATLVLADRRGCAPTELAGRLAAHRITVADLTPAYWHQFLNATGPDPVQPGELRLVIVGGDGVPPADCRRWLRQWPGVRLVNAYGLTETTITSTLCELRPELLNGSSGATAPIGRPVAGATVHLLDAQLRPVPAGRPGEIFVGGPGVALGLWRQPGRTAELFLPDPFAADPGTRMYRTGDLGRWRADGELECLGRLDRQVKIRGYRVDPAEVESVLTDHPAVDQAAVVAEDGALSAFYTTTGPVPESEVTRFLTERLARWMLPARLTELADLPLDHNGKVDRKGLLSAAPPPPAVAEAGPATPLSAGVGELWANLLHLERVGPGDDFFRIGGNSLLATEMLARARIMFGIGIGQLRALTRALLEEPTLAAFARNTQAARAGTLTPGDPPPDFAAEAELGVPIRHDDGPPPNWRTPAAVLLTGATGYCGSHLLDALLRETGARIHCLVRATDPARGLERIREAGLKHLLRDPLAGVAADRVVAEPGDLGAPLLGLTEHRFTELASLLDLILHCGARVNFIYPYRELSAVNVGGTREVVRLAGHARAVPVHQLSSMAVLAGYGAAGIRQVTERTPLGYPQHLSVGYAETKWVAEELLRQASEAGLPVTVHRLNDVTGDAATGAMNSSTEMCALIRLIADAGSAPDVDLPLDFLPADTFARALTYLATHVEATGQAYHLTNPRHPLIGELAARIRAFGYPVEELPYQAWVSRFAEFAAEHPRHPATPFLPLFVDRCSGRPELTVSEMYFRHNFPRFDRSGVTTALAGSGIDFPPVDGALLDRYLRHLIGSGYLALPTLSG
ncbi:amino acid adenylation domain-containing protein [Kitasatospora sp. NPDC002040]|uniref:amino acid adenylation domain-containing protein n=1 Tax=Kitasatospora sp. NPDC002040 TaxID=3154661 RepID=UPI003325BBB5